MKVFISWSGPLSCALAEVLHWWFPRVLQGVTPYFTHKNIDKGARWLAEIARELEDTDFGVSCLTRDNLDARWLLFEAGAISRSVKEARLCPIAFGIEKTEVGYPLQQFQAIDFVKDQMEGLIGTMNRHCGEHRMDKERCAESFEKWWPDLDGQVKALLKEQPAQDQAQKREPQDLLEEILLVTRDTATKVVELSVADRQQKAALVAEELTSARQRLVDVLARGMAQQSLMDRIVQETMRNPQRLEKYFALAKELGIGASQTGEHPGPETQQEDSRD